MCQLFLNLIACLLFLVPSTLAFSIEENFVLLNGKTGESILELGPHINEQVTTCSTFKIVLSLMGFDDGILKDEETPLWPFQAGYDDYLESWKAPQNPQTWLKNSCLWYSKVLALQLGLDKIQNYLAAFEYGNQDMSAGLTKPAAWDSGSLKISSKEQAIFIQKMIRNELPISKDATEITKSLLFIEEFPEGWKLFGKTGFGSLLNEQGIKEAQIGWFVGWIENEHTFYSFAYNLRGDEIPLSQRISRVKELLAESILN